MVCSTLYPHVLPNMMHSRVLEQERDRDKGTEAKPGSEGVQKGRPEKLQRTRVREEPGH